MNAHNPPPGVRETWRRMRMLERMRFFAVVSGTILITTGVTMLLGRPGFLICAGVGAIACAYYAEDPR